MKISLSSTLLLVTMIAIAVAWYADRSRLARKIDSKTTAESFEELCLSVTKRDYETRLDGVSALHEHGGDSVVAPLMYALGDIDLKIATTARDALEDLTGESFRQSDAPTATSIDLRNEWGRWIEWYRNKYQDADVQTLPLFEMYVQSSMQKTNFGKNEPQLK